VAKGKKQSGLTFSGLRSALDQGKIASLYLIAGQEHFLAEEAVRAISEAVTSRSGDCERGLHHGDNVDLATVLDTLRTPGLFSPTRLVIVSPADRFVEKYQKGLGAYAAAPASNSHLLLVVDKIDARKKLAKDTQTAGGVIACNRLYERDFVPWITARAKAMGRRVNSAAASLLLEFLGTDLALLASELEKLAVYIGDRKKITAKDVENVSLRDRGRETYELTDAIGRRQPARALTVLEGLLERGSKETGILFGVARHMRRLWTVKELVAKGAKPVDAARKVGVQYFIDQFLAQVDTFSLRELRYNCSALMKCDAALKDSVIADKRILLETAFIRLVTRKKGRSVARAS
jgi:DNA polymerase-3 subunit delta